MSVDHVPAPHCVLPSQIHPHYRPRLDTVAHRSEANPDVSARVSVRAGRLQWGLCLLREGRTLTGYLDTPQDWADLAARFRAHSPAGSSTPVSCPPQVLHVLGELVPLVVEHRTAVIERLRDEVDRVDVTSPRVLRRSADVFTDASVGRPSLGAGFGWVLTPLAAKDEPLVGCAFHDTRIRVAEAELLAGLTALLWTVRRSREHRWGLQSVHLHTDSRIMAKTLPAVLAGERPLPHGVGAHALADRLLPRIADLQVRVSWVKGHAGHRWNEAADRLALGVRRNHQCGAAHLDEELRRRVAREAGRQVA